MARDVGHDFGETLAKLGLPLTDSVQAFILHRDPIMNAVTQLMKKRRRLPGVLWRQYHWWPVSWMKLWSRWWRHTSNTGTRSEKLKKE